MMRFDARMLMGTCLVAAWVWMVGQGCTAPQRRVVRTVLDLADAVCGDNDTPEQCLTKCQTELDRQKGRTQ